MDTHESARPQIGVEEARMQRYAMVTRLRPERRDEYLRLHAAVWPSVERTLVDDPCQEALGGADSARRWAPMEEIWHLAG